MYYHPTENRFLTTREAASLQSFPGDFEFIGSNTSQWNYSFFGVMKRDNKISSKPSKYDIEELEGREFPFKD